MDTPVVKFIADDKKNLETLLKEEGRRAEYVQSLLLLAKPASARIKGFRRILLLLFDTLNLFGNSRVASARVASARAEHRVSGSAVETCH